MPSLAELHPSLATALQSAARKYALSNPGRCLSLVWGHRSLQKQQEAHVDGKSKIDGITRFSLHNYSPALAADCWVTVTAMPDRPYLVCGRADKVKPPVGLIVLSSKLKMTGGLDLSPSEVFAEYKQYGRAAVATTVGLPHTRPGSPVPWANTLEWGGSWKKFVDGPHVQLAERDRYYLLQKMLAAGGWYNDALDGLFGPKTKRAVTEAGRHFNCRAAVSRGPLRCHPQLWRRLHDELGECNEV